MHTQNGTVFVLLMLTLTLLLLLFQTTTSKSIIEPCWSNDKCSALVGYTLYTDLKVSEVATLFNVDPISLLATNSIDFTYPYIEDHILPSGLFLKVPITCSCTEGIFRSTATQYTTGNSDSLNNISNVTYSRLVSVDQIKEDNTNVSDPINAGTHLTIHLPCTCFNGTDNNLPAIYMSYVVNGDADTLSGIASRYQTTVTDLMHVNSLVDNVVDDGDILAIGLSACSSNFPKYASDYSLSVPNGSYAITAGHCVQCSCGGGSRNLYCMPASLVASCSSMQCRGSNLMLGNITTQQTSGGCNVTSCKYNGFANGTIITALSSSLQPRCPGPQQFPPLTPPPTTLGPDSVFAPAPTPAEAGDTTAPKSSMVPATGSGITFPPANGPTSSAMATSGAYSLLNAIRSFQISLLLVLGLSLGFILFVSL